MGGNRWLLSSSTLGSSARLGCDGGRARRERRRRHHAANEPYELSAFHLITSSAIATSVGVISSVFAVLPSVPIPNGVGATLRFTGDCGRTLPFRQPSSAPGAGP